MCIPYFYHSEIIWFYFCTHLGIKIANISHILICHPVKHWKSHVKEEERTYYTTQEVEEGRYRSPDVPINGKGGTKIE